MAKLDPETFTAQDYAVDNETLAIILAVFELLGKRAGPGTIEKAILVKRQVVQEYRQGKG